MRVLLAGGTGEIGREVATVLHERGHSVRLLARSAERAARVGTVVDVVLGDAMDPATLRGCCDGVDVVVSAIGGNVSLGLKERRGYARLDPVANGNLLAEALRAGVPRFVYVGVHTEPSYAFTRYCVAHETFVDALRRAPVTSTVVRPTGVFSALAELVDMARKGRGSVIGSGEARSNPVHPRDVASVVVDCIASGPADVAVGGPEILTRRQVVETAFAAVGKTAKVMRVPRGVILAMSVLLRPFHPRLSDLFQFVAYVATNDAIAPQVGAQRLQPYFGQRRA